MFKYVYKKKKKEISTVIGLRHSCLRQCGQGNTQILFLLRKVWAIWTGLLRAPRKMRQIFPAHMSEGIRETQGGVAEPQPGTGGNDLGACLPL